MSSSERCPHFQTHIERLPLELTTALLPVRRCLLSERMVRLLKERPEAFDVILAFAKETEDERIQAVCGPDFDAVEHGRCTTERCSQRCLPAYEQILSGFDIRDTGVVDCSDPSPASEAAVTCK